MRQGLASRWQRLDMTIGVQASELGTERYWFAGVPRRWGGQVKQQGVRALRRARDIYVGQACPIRTLLVVRLRPCGAGADGADYR